MTYHPAHFTRQINALNAALVVLYRSIRDARSTEGALNMPAVGLPLKKANANLVNAGDAWMAFGSSATAKRMLEACETAQRHLRVVAHQAAEAADAQDRLLPETGSVAVRRASEAVEIALLAFEGARSDLRDAAHAERVS